MYRIERTEAIEKPQNIQAEHFTSEIYGPDGNFKPLRTTSCK